MKIPINEIKLEPTSGLDTVGKVFRWRNEIYRGIHREYSRFYKELLSSQLINELVEIGLIPTQITPFKVDGFDLILKHQTIPVISYASEWSTAMLKDAALLTCDLQIKLYHAGYTLKDAHPWNILFDRGRPKLTDIGSIIQQQPSAFRFFLDDYRATFLYPLLLLRAGLFEIVDAMLSFHLSTDSDGRFKFPIYRILFSQVPIREWVYHFMQQKRINTAWKSLSIKGPKLLRQQIQTIPETAISKTVEVRHKERETDWSKDALGHLVREVLSELQPKTVIDIGTDDGYFAELSHHYGSRVVAVDMDNNKINQLYRKVRVEGLNIYPIRLDICKPNLKHGPWGICDAAYERFRSELVMAFGLIPSLVRKRYIPIEKIVYYLWHFTERWLLLDFTDSEHPILKQKHSKRFMHSDYRLENLLLNLRLFFMKAKIYKPIEPNRWLIFCADPIQKFPEAGSTKISN